MSKTLSDFEDAKAKLYTEEVDGVNLYEHLTKTVMDLVKHKRDAPLSNLEDICTVLRQSTFIHQIDGLSKDDSKSQLSKDQGAWVGSVSSLMRTQSPSINWDSANLLEHAGINIGKKESYLLHKQMKSLPAQNTRLWGKILGTNSDYFVVEGDAVNRSTEFDKFAMDRPGYNGANLKTYWVCSGAGAEFTQLPDVTSEQIIGAKQIKKFFTGNLDAPVESYPVFPGNEANLLRAQVCCISVATTLIPGGVFSEAEAPEEEDAEFDASALVVDGADLMEKAVPTVDMNDVGAWQYYYPGGGDLNAYGRCTATPPKLDSEGEPIEDENEPEFKPPMAGIGDDEANAAKWSLKLIKDSLLLKITNSEWPGSVSVGYGQPYPKCINFYVGYGVAAAARGYNPPLAPPMQEEYAIPEEVEEEDYFGKLSEHPDQLVDPNQEEDNNE